jgi:hypothetical protein
MKIEVWPGVWLELSRSHHLWPKLSLLGKELSHEVLTTLRRHQAISRETEFLIECWAFNVLRPAVQHYGEEVGRG